MTIPDTYRADLHDAPTMPSVDAARAVASAHVQTRPTPAEKPVVDLCRYLTSESLVRAVVEALEGAGLVNAVRTFKRRSAKAVGPNALHQIASDFVRLRRSM